MYQLSIPLSTLLGASTILYVHLHLKFFNFAVSSIDNIGRFIRPCNADWINLQRKKKMPRVTFEHFFNKQSNNYSFLPLDCLVSFAENLQQKCP